MNKIANNRTIVIICLFVLVYCLSVLVEKRINPDTEFAFNLWSPYYLLFTILIPLAILLPIRLLPSSRYTNYILQKEKVFSKNIVLSTMIVLIYLILWSAGIAILNSIDSSFGTSEAETAALTSIKNDTIFKAMIGYIDSIEPISSSISSKVASFHYILHGKDTALNIEVLLSREHIWIVDTTIIK